MLYETKSKFTVSGNDFQAIYKLAENDFLSWCARAGGEKQCSNNINGCLIGALAEYGAILYLKEYFKNNNIEHTLQPWGMKERQDGKPYYKPDIRVITPTKTLSYEVKGCNPRYPLGQIKPYYINKYIQSNVDRIILTSVLPNDKNAYKATEAVLEVYSCITPQHVKEHWKMKPSLQGIQCYTHPDYF